MKSIATSVLVGVALLAGGCASRTAGLEGDEAATTGFAAIAVPAGGYARTFDQTRDLLRDMGFILERVDAQMGVITTRPKGTGGVFTPWDQEQTSLGQELEDSMHRNQRIVRVEFAPEGAAPGEAADLRTEQRPVGGRVSVAVYRWQLPGWRLNTQAVLESSYTHDPQLDERGMGMYGVAIRQDDDLAAMIARNVRDRMAAADAKRPG